MLVDAFASYSHYYDHLQPIFDALGDMQGTFYTTPSVGKGQLTRGLLPSDDPLLVAGYPDLKRTRRPAIFVEHGAGENYGRDDAHYSGGVGRERVELFLCPNRKVYEANEEKYPGRSVIVGSPRLEWLAQQMPAARSHRPAGEVTESRLRVALGFHWNCRVHPQAGTGLFDFQPFLKSWAGDSRIELAGHAHPRIASRAERIFAAAGIEFIRGFADVVQWADVYAVDNSSTLFEAVALGLPVVVLDAIHYTPEQTGWRFWTYADVGPRIQVGGSLPDAAIRAVSESAMYDEIRRQAVTDIFGVVEGSTMKAVEAIRHHGSTGPTSPAHAGPIPAQPPIFRIP